MTSSVTSPGPETNFGRGAWLTLTLAGLLLGVGLAVLAYRFTLPTDGWKVEFRFAAQAGQEVYLYQANELGAASGLRPGDVVLAVEGVRVEDWEALASLAPRWRAGAMVTYTVQRAGQALPVAVTLVPRQFWRWLGATLRDPAEAAYLGTSYLLLALSALVFARRPGNLAAQAFFLLNALLVTTDLVTATVTVGWSEAIDPLARVLTGDLANGLLYGVLQPSVLLRFALIFPRPKPSLLRRPWLAWVPAVVSVPFLLLSPPNFPLPWLWFVASLVLTLAILTHSAITMRDVVSRAQLLWGLGGLIVGLGLLALLLLAGTFGLVPGLSDVHFDLGGALATTIIGLTLSIAITRYRLFEIDVLIRRTLVYSALTGILALAYFGSVLVLQSVFRALTGQGQNSLVVVLSTLAIAALFGPVRSRVQRAIDRRFYRRKYDAARTLAGFAASARDETDLARLSERLVNVVDETMQPAQVSLWLRATSKTSMPLR